MSSSKLSENLLDPDELARDEDWRKHDAFKLYALYPSSLNRYQHGLIRYTKDEWQLMQIMIAKHQKTKLPEPSYALDTPVYPSQNITNVAITAEIENDLEQMNYEEFTEKYPMKANAPANPFAKKRLISKLPCSWECDETAGKDEKEILASLHHMPVHSLDGKQKKMSKFPILHSDKIHTIHPSWYYQPSTYISYANLSKGGCTVIQLKKSNKPHAKRQSEFEGYGT